MVSKTWNEIAADWLRVHPGWHESREIAGAVGYPDPYRFTGILHKALGVQWKWRGALVQMMWRFKGACDAGDIVGGES